MSNPVLLVTLLVAVMLQQDELQADERLANQRKIETLLDRFSGSDKATPFCLGHYRKSAYAVAIFDTNGFVRVVVGGNRRGQIYTLKLDTVNPPGLHLEDLDGDGRAELFVCTSVVEAYRLTDDGLQKFWTSDRELVSRPPPRVVLADVNLDGLRDVLVLNFKHLEPKNTTQCLYSYLQTDDASLTLRPSGSLTFTDHMGNHMTYGIAVGNFYGDARPEIVIGNEGGVLWNVEFENGTLATKHTWKVPLGAAIWTGLAAGNLTDDKSDELLIGTEGGDIFAYRLSAAEGPKQLASKHAGKYACFVGATDLDGDDKDEFVLARGYLGSVFVSEQGTKERQTERDVVCEVYKMEPRGIDGYEFDRVLIKQAEGIRRPHLVLHDLNRDGVKDIMLYPVSFTGPRIQFVDSKLTSGDN